MRLALALALLLPMSSLQAAEPSWVERSNAHAQVLLEAQAAFVPEQASSVGLYQFDTRVIDLRPQVGERFRAAMGEAVAELRRRLAAEGDAQVRQDLEIMITSAEEQIEASEVNQRLTLPWVDVGQIVFGSVQSLLQEQVAEQRRGHALQRLKQYVGSAAGSHALAAEARARYLEASADPTRLAPVRASVEQALQNAPIYLDGIRKLFAEFKIEGAEADLAALEQQLDDYADWTRREVLPKTRTDFRLPRELYALSLKGYGVDADPEQVAQRARAAFIETRNAMQALAPQVAKAQGIEARDYRALIRALKKASIPNDQLEAHYLEVNRKLEDAIRTEAVVSLPTRPLGMRLASDAESAAQPAPHFEPAPLINNQGEKGHFVLPVANPASKDAYDDFNFAAVAWTLSAHEGRPGHELQFTAMTERGVSLARSLLAFNSVNVEGWALYAEAEMVPMEPIEGQLFALQFRLLRAARAMLDPMLNLGQIELAEAERILREDVVLSPGMVQQELDRYTFNAPGQATSYFYGYQKILDIRAEAEIALGARFERKAFNDFLLDQGLLPPALLQKAVREQFIAPRRAEKASA